MSRDSIKWHLPRVKAVGRAGVVLNFGVLTLHVMSLCVVSGCTGRESGVKLNSSRDEKPQVCVVSYPLAYFARRIGAEHITVHFPVPSNEAPAGWNPSANDVGLFQQADLILINGAGYARWMDRFSLPDSKVVNTTADVRQDYLFSEDSVTHQHGPDGEHTHRELASMTWLDFQIAVAQARAVKETLVRLLPDEIEGVQARFETLEKELIALDQSLLSAASDERSVTLLCARPLYQYLARRYGFSLRCLHWETDKVPGQSVLDELRDSLAAQPAKAILWHEEPLPQMRSALEQLGLSVVVFKPADSRPGEGDFLEVMSQNVLGLKPYLE